MKVLALKKKEFIESQKEPTWKMPPVENGEPDPEPTRDTIYTFEYGTIEWKAYNKAYYDLRVMEYEVMYKTPAIVSLRKKAKAVILSSQWKRIQIDFKKLTGTKDHKEIVKLQLDTFEQASKIIKMTPIEAKNLSPQTSPIMFDGLHFLYVYFLAMEKGNVKPLLDFLVDGKYDREYVEGVDPDFFQPPRMELDAELLQ